MWPGAFAPGHNLYKLFVIFGRSPAIIKDRLLIQSPSSFIYDTFVIHLYQLDDVIIRKNCEHLVSRKLKKSKIY